MVHAIVDLSNLFYRARYGAQGDTETKVGMALLILFRSLRKLHRDLSVDHMVFAVDQGSWRYAIYPAYKSYRRKEQLLASEADRREDRMFAATLDSVINYLANQTRSTVLRCADIEGDDFVAAWVAKHPQDQHVIISGDSDFVQLLAPNVRIYDAINLRMIDIERIVDQDNRALRFSVNPKNGKIKVGKPEPEFRPEEQWWRKALFIKLIRGDTTDSIFSAYPGVRYDGKKVGINLAWQDRQQQGYDWNNFMFQTWDKLTGISAEGHKLVETVRVVDQYRFNQQLIDLTKQPDWVITKMNETIKQAITRDLPKQIGIFFLRFCRDHNLPSLAKEANDHVTYLNNCYPVSAA